MDKSVLILHKADGETDFIPFPMWETALDWEDVSYEPIFNGERVIRNGQTIGVIVYQKERKDHV